MKQPGFLTLTDPNLTEQEDFSCCGGGAVLAQTGEDGQSPQEQPSEVSPHEYVDTFIGFIPDDSGAIDLNVMA